MSQEDSSKSGVPLVKPPLGMPKEGVMRPGRGFSYGEIDKAGATVDDVKTAHLRIDPLRKSAHDVNIKALQELLGTRGKERTTQKPKQKAKVKAAATKKGKTKGTSGKK
jgi:ribosomal protein L13E